MKKFTGVFFFACLCASLFAQTGSSEVVGTWKHDKEGLTFKFNADGSFTMGEEGEAARQTIEQEQRGQGEVVVTSVDGTYTVNKGKIEMLMFVDGKTHKVRMSYKLIDANTLRMDGQNYRRVK
jgi:hypothetical protein